jgi:hypothetical protein
VVDSEEQQAALYEWLKVYIDDGLERDSDGVLLFENAKMKVVAV